MDRDLKSCAVLPLIGHDERLLQKVGNVLLSCAVPYSMFEGIPDNTVEAAVDHRGQQAYCAHGLWDKLC